MFCFDLRTNSTLTLYIINRFGSRRVRETAESDYYLRHNCLSVHPSAWNNLTPTGRIFVKLDICRENSSFINPLTPNDPYRGRTTLLTSTRFILYIYSTNIGTEYFKDGIYSQFFPLQNAVCFVILTYLFPVLFTFYIQDVLK